MALRANTLRPRLHGHSECFFVGGVLRPTLKVVGVEHDGNTDPLVRALVKHPGREHPRLVIVLQGESKADAIGKPLPGPTEPLKGFRVLTVSTAHVEVDLSPRGSWKAHNIHDLTVRPEVTERVLHD